MRVLDLFSGIGGFSLGLERAGMETVAFCEIEEYPRKVLAKHWPDVPIYDDVRTLTYDRLKQDGIGSIDVICGGFPCQDLSVAGKKAGFDGERSSLYREMLRIISDCRPKYGIFENVTGLLSGESGRWFAQFLYDLAQVGYDAEWHCISASELGAHHHRDRVWIIAYPNLQRCKGGTNVENTLYNQLFKSLREFKRDNGMPDNAEPGVRGSFDGVPQRLDRRRLKGLGNAVVPQIPEIIGKAIMATQQPNITLLTIKG